MTGVRLTKAEIRALGINPDEYDAVVSTPRSSRRRTRQTAPGRYGSECHDCGAVFTTQAAETRHVAHTGHARYQLTLLPPVTPIVEADTCAGAGALFTASAFGLPPEGRKRRL